MCCLIMLGLLLSLSINSISRDCSLINYRNCGIRSAATLLHCFYIYIAMLELQEYAVSLSLLIEKMYKCLSGNV